MATPVVVHDMSERGDCQLCDGKYKLTKAGMIPKHGSCSGGGGRPLPAYDLIEARFLEEVSKNSELERFFGRHSIVEWGRRLFSAKVDHLSLVERASALAEMTWLESMLGKLGQVFWEVKAWREYGHCCVCGGEHTAEATAWARRRLEAMPCSDECRQKKYIRDYACCDKAKQTPCVCVHSFSCPVHGEMHVGTHD